MPTWYPTIVQKAISMPQLTLLEKRGEYIKHSSGYSSIVRGRTYFCERCTRTVQHIYFIDTRYLNVRVREPMYAYFPRLTGRNYFLNIPTSIRFHIRNITLHSRVFLSREWCIWNWRFWNGRILERGSP